MALGRQTHYSFCLAAFSLPLYGFAFMCVFCALLEDVTVTWLYGYRLVEYGGGEREGDLRIKGWGGFKNTDRGMDGG